MFFDDFGDLDADFFEWIETRHGILKHGRNLRAANGFPLFVGFQGGEFMPLEHDRTGVDPTIRFEHAREGFREHCLAASRFADNRERLSVV